MKSTLLAISIIVDRKGDSRQLVENCLCKAVKWGDLLDTPWSKPCELR